MVGRLIEQAAAEPLVMAALRQAGWTEGYRHDPDEWVAELQSDGYSTFPLAVDVLRHLGGLTVNPPRHPGAVFASGPIVLDPVFAASGEADRIVRREEQLGVELCPVGEWMGEYILLVAGDGRVIAETTFQVLCVGHDIADALKRMIVADTPTEELLRS